MVVSPRQSTKAVYDRIIDLRIATPQIIINYAMFLEEHNYFEESFKVTPSTCPAAHISLAWSQFSCAVLTTLMVIITMPELGPV